MLFCDLKGNDIFSKNMIGNSGQNTASEDRPLILRLRYARLFEYPRDLEIFSLISITFLEKLSMLSGSSCLAMAYDMLTAAIG